MLHLATIEEALGELGADGAREVAEMFSRLRAAIGDGHASYIDPDEHALAIAATVRRRRLLRLGEKPLELFVMFSVSLAPLLDRCEACRDLVAILRRAIG